MNPKSLHTVLSVEKSSDKNKTKKPDTENFEKSKDITYQPKRIKGA